MELNLRTDEWPFGTAFIEDMLRAVTLIADGKAKRIDTDSCLVYKAGSIIRIDIPEKEVSE